MRLPQVAATLLQRAFPIRPIVPNSNKALHAKYLHDDTKPDLAPQKDIQKDIKHSDANERSESTSPNVADSQPTSKETDHEKNHDEGGTAKVRRRQPWSEANRKKHMKRIEEQRASGYAALTKYLESQRAAGFPVLRRNHEADRAAGFPSLRKAHEIVKASLQRDVEEANRRKLAKDPTFVSPPQLRPIPRSKKPTCTMPCPKPGCEGTFRNERGLKYHMRRCHGGYSQETPHKCKHDGCDLYWETEEKADAHLRTVHEVSKVECPECDRMLNAHNLKRHRREVHGIVE